MIMKKIFAIAIVTAAVSVPVAASAGERVNDMALGAASGALVAGPVGLVAGGVIGYVAGPDIGRSMGLHRHNHSERSRSTAARRSSKAGDARAADDTPPAAH
jgi:hypothetical protein